MLLCGPFFSFMIGGEYAGELRDGVRDGYGKLTWANGDYYEGDFKNGLRHGTGTFCEKGGRKYQGSWALSMREGEGHECWKNGDEYHGRNYFLFDILLHAILGNYSRDKFDGHGELTTLNAVYKGQFKENYKCGMGTITFKHGGRYEGLWSRGRFHGKGVYFWPDGRRYEGDWEDGMRQGIPIIFVSFFINGES